MRGKVITLLARLGKGPKHRSPVLEHARMRRDGAVDIHGDGFALRYLDPGEPLPEGLVPLRWLANMAKQAGRGSASFEAVPGGKRIAARVKTSTYGVDVSPCGDDFPDVAAPPTTHTAVPLSVADWSAGGGVVEAVGFASPDATRERLYGVYLGIEIAATNGHMLKRCEAVGFMPALSGVLPLPAVQAVLRLVAETCPTEMVAHVGPPTKKMHTDDREIVLTARAEHGVVWRLVTTLVHGFPDMNELNRVQSMAEHMMVDGAVVDSTLVEVDAADMRELWLPLRTTRSMELAVYKDGTMLCWGDGTNGIGTTLRAMPTEKPAFVLGLATLPLIAKRLPPKGRVKVRTSGLGHSCTIAGEVFMQMRHESLPEYVQQSLAVAFAE